MKPLYSIHQLEPRYRDWCNKTTTKIYLARLRDLLHELCKEYNVNDRHLNQFKRIDIDTDEYGIIHSIIALEKQHATIIEQLASQQNRFHSRRLLVLDFDGTLVYTHSYDPTLEMIGASHYGMKPRNYDDFMSSAPPGGIEDGLGRLVYPRPFLPEFLDTVGAWGFELTIYSTATYAHIVRVADLCKIDLNRFLFVWPRGYCERDGDRGYSKPVSKFSAFGFQRRNILQMEDDSDALGPRPNNGLEIAPYFGCSNDTVLHDILSDVSHYRNRDVAEFNRQKFAIEGFSSLVEIDRYLDDCSDSVLIDLAMQRRDLLLQIKRQSVENNKRLLAKYQEKLHHATNEQDRLTYQHAITAITIHLTEGTEWIDRNLS